MEDMEKIVETLINLTVKSEEINDDLMDNYHSNERLETTVTNLDLNVDKEGGYLTGDFDIKVCTMMEPQIQSSILQQQEQEQQQQDELELVEKHLHLDNEDNLKEEKKEKEVVVVVVKKKKEEKEGEVSSNCLNNLLNDKIVIDKSKLIGENEVVNFNNFNDSERIKASECSDENIEIKIQDDINDISASSSLINHHHQNQCLIVNNNKESEKCTSCNNISNIDDDNLILLSNDIKINNNSFTTATTFQSQLLLDHSQKKIIKNMDNQSSDSSMNNSSSEIQDETTNDFLTSTDHINNIDNSINLSESNDNIETISSPTSTTITTLTTTTTTSTTTTLNNEDNNTFVNNEILNSYNCDLIETHTITNNLTTKLIDDEISMQSFNVNNTTPFNDGETNTNFIDDNHLPNLMCDDNEISQEIVTTHSSTSTVSSTKSSTKIKKKKTEAIITNNNNNSSNSNISNSNSNSGNTSPLQVNKKTKKTKKSELEKENISVNHQVCQKLKGISYEDNLSNVNVKSLTQCYTLEITKPQDKNIPTNKRIIQTGVFINELKSSFNKFDALSKKSVLNTRSSDTTKIQQQLQNSININGDEKPNCRSCNKVVFQMEQIKAESLVWHKNCFKCNQCNKQLNVDNYESNECILYCKAHFKELFQPKPVDESNQPVCLQKPEMIIRENQPKELPPDVVRASDKPDLGLEELSSLNVKSRFQAFEKSVTETTNNIDKSPSQILVKRSPSILSKLAKFQAKGMDIGVADESLNGIPYEESSESEEEEDSDDMERNDDDEVDDANEKNKDQIVKSKRSNRERPTSFTKMDDIKNRWEATSQQERRDFQREVRKEELAGIRSRLFMGKQGKMKEMYQQAVATSDKIVKINPIDEIQHSNQAKSIKERFEKGEPIVDTNEESSNHKYKQETPDENVIAAGIGRKSRSLFLEMDASVAKTGRPVTPVLPKAINDTPKRARDAFMARQVSDDVVRSSDKTEDVRVETSDISNKFKFFETYKEPEKEKKQFRITPPRDGQVKMNSPEREIYRDPEIIRSEDRVDEVVHTDTTKKMLSIFRQMEENATKEDVPNGPKPLKCFTPPPEDKYANKRTNLNSDEDAYENDDDGGGDDDDEDVEDVEENENGELVNEKNPNYVRASDKVEDEFLKQAQNATMAKTLRAKFEQWEINEEKTNINNIEKELYQTTDGEQINIKTARSLKEQFESLSSQPVEHMPRTPKVKVNRFVELPTLSTDICENCEKRVYALEKIETNNKIFHKQCFRCVQCNCVLRMDTFTMNNGRLYCIPHFKQLFITCGNYDEGFGVDPHKNKWTANISNDQGSIINNE